MKERIGLVVTVLLTCLLSVAVAPVSAADEAKRVSDSVRVLQEITALQNKGIPPTLFREVAGIAVIPGVLKAGFIVGGRFGTGILVARDKNGVWSSPVFISTGGGSVGWQIGAQSTDFILVFRNSKSIDAIMKGKFTLGVDAAVAAGPVGRNIEAGTDPLLKAEIYSYSQSRGLFAGFSLEGAVLYIDDAAAAAFYRREHVAATDILAGKVVSTSPEVVRLREVLTKYVASR